jgi:LysR family transcriptional regulator, nitrogen assimilation regulatory protein
MHNWLLVIPIENEISIKMDFKQLEYFLKVAELGSFTKAANTLNIAQPTLSRQVLRLETELEQTLLTRNGRGAIATEAGRKLMEYAKGILYQVELAKRELSRTENALTAKVSIGLPSSVAKVLTVPLTHAFKRRLPQALLSVTEGLSTSLQDSLMSGRLDIALLYNPVAVSEMHTEPLLFEELFLIAKNTQAKKVKKTNVSLASLTKEPLIIPTRPNAIRMLVESELSNHGLLPTIMMEIDGVGAILDLVADGLGKAVLPMNAILTAPRPERYQCQKISGLRSQLVMATSTQRPASNTQIAMQELIVELASRHVNP